MSSFFAVPNIRNAAVKIVAPPSPENGEQKLTATSKKDTTQRQCRNIMIHGFCKYEGKGCMYQHPQKEEPVQYTETTESRDETNGTSHAITALPAQAVNAPVFVPRSIASPSRSEKAPLTSPIPSFPQSTEAYETYEPFDTSPENGSCASIEVMSVQLDQLGFADYDEQVDDQMLAQPRYAPVPSIEPYYPPQQTLISQPLNYHLYTLPNPTSEGRKFFISDHLREDLQKRSEAIYSGLAPGMSLPDELQGYHSLVSLEVNMMEKKMGAFSSMMYKATKVTNGRTYALRRVENFRLMNEHAFNVLDKWVSIKHPGIVAVHEAFTSRAFGDNSLLVVYDYHPNARSLAEVHFKPNKFQGSRPQQPDKIGESALWSYIFQIASAMKAVHDAGLGVRMIDASKILLTGKDRVRIGSCAMIDILLYDTRQDPYLLQQEDMIMFAKLIMSLACGNPGAVNNVHQALDHVHRVYPGNIKDVIHFLMKPLGPMKNIQGLFTAFGEKMVAELDAAHAAVDNLEGELMGELENARLVRLLCKFGFINERPEFDRDPRWSETGDRYIIKLFRDYVFHSVDDNGNPVINLAHVLANLNKLDAGSDERLMLVSRNEQSCLVVTYRQIRNCIESTFSDLARRNR